MKLFLSKTATALLFVFAVVAATASAAEVDTGRALQVDDTTAPTPMTTMHEDSHDGHDHSEHSDAPTPSPADMAGNGAAALGGAKNLAAAVGCAVTAGALML